MQSWLHRQRPLTKDHADRPHLALQFDRLGVGDPHIPLQSIGLESSGALRFPRWPRWPLVANAAGAAVTAPESVACTDSLTLRLADDRTPRLAMHLSARSRPEALPPCGGRAA